MRRTEPLRSFTDRPGYGDECAVCPFCGKINDAPQPETYCHHLVQWNDPGTVDASATFTDSPRQEQAEREKQQKKEGSPNS